MASVKLAYGSSTAVTISPASVATSSTWIAGTESTAIDNTSNLFLDYLLAGYITVGTSPTASTEIRIYVYGSQNDTPLYPDVLDGTSSAETFTSAAIRDGSLKLAAVMAVDATTSDRAYYFAPVSVASLFGGTLPKYWGVFLTHNTGVNLNATAGNHVISYTGVYETIA